MNVEQMLARANEQDLMRQRQVEAQKQVVNRLLEARESEADDASLIRDLCEERRVLEEDRLQIKAICEEAVAGGNNSSYIDRILGVLNG